MYYTTVETLYDEKQANDRLLFGDPIERQSIDGSRKRYVFSAGQIFGYVWWERNDYGTQYWACAVLAAVTPEQNAYALPRIMPGADVYLYAAGKGKNQPGPVERSLALIDTIREAGFQPEYVPAAYWRAAAFAIRSQRAPRALTLREYRAAKHATPA